MHLHIIDHYQKMKSPIHQMDGRIKLVLSVAIIISCALLPINSWPVYIFLAGILISLTILSDLNLWYVLKRSLIVLPFLLTAVPLVFHGTGTEIFTLNVDKLTLIIYPDGLSHFASLGIKSWLSVIAAILLASTTNFPELLHAMRAVKVPRLLVAVIGLMWRYMFLMVEEVDRMTRARLSRSGQSFSSSIRTGGSLLWRAHVTGGMAGSLFIRSLERSERVYSAMLSRGYDGEIRALEEPPISRRAVVGLVASIGSLLLLVIFAYLLQGVG
jgi:cobalt/nickel transport system permease protein